MGTELMDTCRKLLALKTYRTFFGRRRTHKAEHNNPTATGDNRYQIMVWFSGWHFHANLRGPQHLRRNVRCPPLQALRRRKTKLRHAVQRPQLREAQTSNHFSHSSILVGVTRHDHHSEIHRGETGEGGTCDDDEHAVPNLIFDSYRYCGCFFGVELRLTRLRIESTRSRRPTTSADHNTATPMSKSKRRETLNWTTDRICNYRNF